MDNEIKAIFFDIDGTLVSIRTHAIPLSTLQAVHDARKSGIRVFIATGRPLPFIDNLDQLEYDGIISFNGGLCQLTNGQVISKLPIDKDEVQRMVELCESRHIPVAFASPERAVMSCHNEVSMHIYNMLNIAPPAVEPLSQIAQMDILQMIAFLSSEEETSIMQEVLPGCVAQRWHSTFADIVRKGIDKAQGIDAIIHHLGIDLEQTMAFGDGGNDIGMLRHVAIGVAMGNATEDVKQSADYVTADVDSDGVALAMKKFLKL